MRVMAMRPFIPSLALLLGGCAAGGTETMVGYPSLARRPIESQQQAAAAPVEVSPTVPDAELDSALARLVAAARAGDDAFASDYGEAERLTRQAAGSAVSSEAWVAAQVALSTLESARNDSVSALASLDTLYVERANAIADGKAQGGLDQIDRARADALAVVDSQNDRLDALKAALRPAA
jgi:hypothetical protein